VVDLELVVPTGDGEAGAFLDWRMDFIRSRNRKARKNGR